MPKKDKNKRKFLDSVDDKEPQFSGSRWTKVIKSF